MINKKTYVKIVLDRSGSMAIAQKETIGAFNEQVQELRKMTKDGMETYVSLITFNSDVLSVLENVSVDVVKELTANDYKPDGMTALFDAVHAALDEGLAQQDSQDANTAFLLVIITDGEENQSRKANKKNLAERLQAVQATKRWTVTYLGARKNLHVLATDLNIPKGNVMSFDAGDASGYQGGFMSTSVGLGSFMAARAIGTSSIANFYINDENGQKGKKK
ncbi:VWA domain-containing protein [Pelosinus sp. sgz500959]|uniref:vWA domain-containing protein n=1 Tax=Pelosinus sp. sgz500959 TaxID=3242472 RepID=UPI00366DFF0A